MDATARLIEIINDIAQGNYSNDIMPLTTGHQPEKVRTIAEAVGMMMVKIEAREYQLEMLIEELRELNETIKRNTIKTVAAMAAALAARDAYTEGHTARVGELAAGMARHMGMDEEKVEAVRLGGILHDIGKIGFPDPLFEHNDAKVPKELLKAITGHPAKGAEILKALDFLGPTIEYVLTHHERPDGKGYPRQLSAEVIPLGAKILAVADSFDAITTDRPYQKGRTAEEALEILRKMAGTRWDADCVCALEEILTAEEA
ncbi:MAG: HD domain-containing protein [Deltaproteobacteria bacterium]|nr:HD domain-containing protein [Deltaproteobacteria bacterium]